MALKVELTCGEHIDGPSPNIICCAVGHRTRFFVPCRALPCFPPLPTEPIFSFELDLDIVLSRFLPNRSMMFLDRSSESGRLPSARFDSLSSLMDVSYSCGSCGYPLHLRSSDRNTSNIGPNYRKAMKKGVVSFHSIDESRFCNTDPVSCLPYFNWKSSWGLFRQRTKLRCRKCVSYIGSAYEEIFPLALFGPRVSDESSSGRSKKYKIRISALQPSSDELDSSFIAN